MSEFNEPWRQDRSHPTADWGDIVDRNGRLLIDPEYLDDPDWASRIVACVNACVGIPTDQLSQNFREFAAKQTGVSIENDPRSVPPLKPFAAGTTAAAAIQKLRDAGLDAWDQVADPEAEIRAIRGEAAPIAWRKEPPDKPGWWWRRSNYGGRLSIRQVVLGAGGELLVDAGAFYKLDHYNDSEWAGPIEPPPVPG